MKVLQIVRRYGPVGGMERYVWELSHALSDLDVEVHILCEQTFQPNKNDNIQIHQLGSISVKPRWISMLRFSHRVSKWVKNNIPSDFIIHSHERTGIHHITTFHGNMFAHLRQNAWWKKISLRIFIWLYLEKREVCNNQVQVVLPNSDLIREKLKEYYPCIGQRLKQPAFPGVHIHESRIFHENPEQVIIFIGQEWKRKGLVQAIQIVSAIKKIIPTIQFWVLGPDPKEVEHLFHDWKSDFKLLGWQDSGKFLQKSSLLLHPAISEPYGMAIAEATSMGIPVVVSNHCGIANQITSQSGQVIDANNSTDYWAEACITELNRKHPVKSISNSWEQLAKQHITIYKKINFETTNDN